MPLTGSPITCKSKILISGLDSKTTRLKEKLLSSSTHSSISLRGSTRTIIVWLPKMLVPVSGFHVTVAESVPANISSPFLDALPSESINAYPIKVSVPFSGKS